MKTLRKKNKKHYLHIIFLLFISILLVIISLIVALSLFSKPQNTRVWETGFEKLPQVSYNKEAVTISHVRDYRYAPKKQLSFGYINRTIPLKDVKKVWFVYEPFQIPQIPWFGGVAHTYFVFDIKGQKPLALSVEARREKGETYDSFKGMLPTYELIYVWASEEDITGRRALIEKNKLYMYPLLVSPQWTQKLFLQLLDTTHSLESNPRFYNSLWSNCTSELVKNANKIKPNSIPFHKGIFFPGYADKMLYDLGYIPHTKPFLQTKKEHFITDMVIKYYKYSNFSKRLRTGIMKK